VFALAFCEVANRRPFSFVPPTPRAAIRRPFSIGEKIMATDSTQKILRLPEVTRRVGISRSSIYLKISGGEFPRPIKLGVRSVGFLESEIIEWIDGRILASRAGEQAARQ
jgi:prophage regulatory protein